jgi:hypothetical protein
MSAYKVLVRKSETKRPLGRPRLSWKDNFKMDHRDIGWCDMDCTNLASGSLENSCEHGNESLGSIKCWEILE